jgi:hypothetical protein
VLIIWASVYKKEKSVRHLTVQSEKADMDDALLDCLQQICRAFDIEMPMWHTKHTKQLSSFRKATFKPGDFIDRFAYDRLAIEILDIK